MCGIASNTKYHIRRITITCIVGFVCPKEKKVYIGGDSAGVAGLNIQIRDDEKVFRNGPFIMGFTTSFRMGQLLRYCFEQPEHTEGMDEMTFMVKNFIPSVKKCFKDGGFGKTKDSEESGGAFLVGYKGRLYEIDNDYQVARLHDNIASVGCGSDIALGAMYGLSHLYPKERIIRALEITTHLNAGVRPPFVIEELPQ